MIIKALALTLALLLGNGHGQNLHDDDKTPHEARHLHGPAERVPDVFSAEMRLFIADASNGDIIVADIPERNVVERLSTPAHIMILGVTDDGRHLFAMRGRDSDRDYVTLVDTGYDPDLSVGGEFRLPYVLRTFQGHSPGGARRGHMSKVGGHTDMVNEGIAQLLVFDKGIPTEGLSALESHSYSFNSPDHYHYQESEGRLYVGHLRAGLVQILDVETGEEVGRIGDCPIVHGIVMDEWGRLFFGCSEYTLVIGTRGDEMSQELARIPYPEEQRAAAYLKGHDGVLWAYTEGTLPLLYRLDTKVTSPYVFTTLTIGNSIRQAVTDDGAFLMLLQRSGELEIRSGDTGELFHSVGVSDGWDSDFHEHVDKAILPDIVADPTGTRAFVSIPDEGRISEVDLIEGVLLHTIVTGGEPTRIVVLENVNATEVGDVVAEEVDVNGAPSGDGNGDDHSCGPIHAASWTLFAMMLLVGAVGAW